MATSVLQQMSRITGKHAALVKLALVGVLAWGGLCSQAAAQGDGGQCGNVMVNGYGPYDYRTDKNKLKIVEDFHFTPSVEALTSGASGPLGADLDYALRAFPNHHRALIAMTNLGLKQKTEKTVGANYPVECYFLRALAFRPDENIVRMLYAKYLAGTARKPQALNQLAAAAELAKDNAFTHYNVGLMYLDFGEYDKAIVQAHLASQLGFERVELKQKLQAAGKWREPLPESVPGSAPGSTPAAAPAAETASAAKSS